MEDIRWEEARITSAHVMRLTVNRNFCFTLEKVLRLLHARVGMRRNTSSAFDITQNDFHEPRAVECLRNEARITGARVVGRRVGRQFGRTEDVRGFHFFILRERLMNITRLVIGAVLAITGTAAFAQEYPSKPIRMVVGFVAGGPTDALARLYAQRLGNALGKQVFIENRGGADGMIAAESIAHSPADGHNLFFASSGHAINASLYANVPYKTIEDFDAVALVGESPNIMAIPASLPVSDLKAFIALAKAKPGALNYGATSSPTFLATELFTSMAGVKIVRVPYKGAAPAMAALMAGDIQLVLSGIGTMLPQVKSGKLKALAVTSAERSALAPEIPTANESGLPSYVATTWYGVLAPDGTPRPIIERLNKETRAVLQEPGMKAQLALQGVVTTSMTPEQFGSFVKSEVAKWAKVVQETGAKPE